MRAEPERTNTADIKSFDAVRLACSAGDGEEPVEGQVYVVAGAGIMLAHELNVIVNRAGIAIRPLTDGPPRTISAAFPSDCPPPTRALVALLREPRGAA